MRECMRVTTCTKRPCCPLAEPSPTAAKPAVSKRLRAAYHSSTIRKDVRVVANAGSRHLSKRILCRCDSMKRNN